MLYLKARIGLRGHYSKIDCLVKSIRATCLMWGNPSPLSTTYSRSHRDMISVYCGKTPYRGFSKAFPRSCFWVYIHFLCLQCRILNVHRAYRRDRSQIRQNSTRYEGDSGEGGYLLGDKSHDFDNSKVSFFGSTSSIYSGR
jgi:hypothetical protein